MRFKINTSLLKEAESFFANRKNIYWLLGGSGAGKSTICQTLAKKFDLPLYDMDAQIYGTYHERFSEMRHPVNTTWSNAENGMAWLLGLDWEAFNNFHQAALPEYLDLLVEDLTSRNPDTLIIIDGGVWHPALLAQALPTEQIVCLATEESSRDVWEGNKERHTMKEMFAYFPDPDTSWQKFLEFDKRISTTVENEARQMAVPLLKRTKKESVEKLTARVIQTLGLE
jgi:ABC-type dipeptide/oligopeptide/nickel transport system ATPase component